jgi:nucleotide-binding universal stress UspA family protein
VLATDFSPCSEKALHHALAIARDAGSTFYLVHVVSSLGFALAGPGTAAAAVELAGRDARELAQKLVQDGSLAGVPHEVVVRQGQPWEELERVVRQYHADLVVIGTHGRTGLRKLALGSVAEDIFRHASCPVLTVGPRAPEQAPAELKALRFLYATDLSAESLAAVPFAVALAQRHQAELTVLHPLEDPKAAGRRELEAQLRELVFDARLPYPPTARVETGPADETILRVAEQQKAHLIVLGLRSPDTYVDHLGWLHAYKIVCEARCPVLTIRSRAEALSG